MTTWNDIDPAWAWAPYEPNVSRPWSRRLAAHLARRAGFGATHDELTELVRLGPAKAAERFVEATEAAAFRDESEQLTMAVLAGGDPHRLASAWLHRMLTTPHPLLEKATLFWHGHFATSAAKVEDARLMADQNRLLRTHALGDFGALVHAISRDPAMLVWLDSATNRKSHPNENYARELMELFCLGEGRYSEDDVLELARCFTGWEVRRERFYFNRRQHDTAMKSLLGRNGDFGGEDAVDIVLARDDTPRFIAFKLFRFFVADEPSPSPELLEPLAETFRENGLRTGPVLSRIFSSNLFYSPHAVGRRVRSPIEFGVGLLRSLAATTNLIDFSRRLANLGQELYFPPSVKGWDGGRTWINSATLLERSNLVGHLVGGKHLRFTNGTLAESADHAGAKTPDEIVAWLSDLLLAVQPPADARQRLVQLASSGDRNRAIAETLFGLATLPEFQLC